ncbi:mitochondrial ribosomal protein subunit L20-domain-containing protein [Triangularia verruculosa]|uniref:Mitochondrial ribosomal protein subunit L20-domain-containing protein n=1 Tax=Triangularia verruculosa TaxID=2587418 RepID=A0AAN6XID6_9PEZI|nr:mitochondrial ribosomal protein subunit L20-domain-containing protein [Triangularia verruculosa]
MEATLSRPAARCCCLLKTTTTSTSRLLPSSQQQSRPKSTRARHKAALNVPPHPSFLSNPSPSSANGATTLIFNPPSSAPSVFQTPFKFLPKSDPRRRAALGQKLFASSVTTNFATAPVDVNALPTIFDDRSPATTPKNHSLTKEDVEEMRRLRLADPVKNSVLNLARQFGCSVMFVMMCVQAGKEHRDKVHVEPHAAARERWGPKKREAKEDRKRRMEMLMRGEI